ncbi:MAG TPA: SurA N-terminal domain-containing protein [Micropepsaceae bacterium]|nr:SurA N-terminal domain-containing protein [Micropepsaceae bacterium]
MLQQLRALSKSWVASVVIGVLVLAFALWGVADIFRGGGDTTVASVGGTDISQQEFSQQLQNQLRTLSAQTQNQITLEQAKAIGLDRSVLDQMISRTALDDEANRLGLTASQATVVAQIQSDPSFRGTDGAFDPNLLARTLQDNGLSEQGFIDLTGKNIAREQLLDSLVDGIAAPPGLTRILYDYANQTRTVQYIVLTPQDAGTVPEPSEADLAAYHKAHAQQFSSPEYRSLDYVEIGPDQVAGQVQISDADLKAQYDSHRADYQKPEQREVQQLSFPDKAAADAAAAKITNGMDFLNVAQQRGLKDQDLTLGTFAAGAPGLDPTLSKAVFAVPEGGVTPPVQGPFGWVILRAAKVIPGENKSFDDVKDQIKADLLKARAAGKVADMANAFEDARGGGASLAQAAAKLGLTVQHVPAVDRQGMTPENTQADLPKSMQFLDQAFRTEAGEESDLFMDEAGNNFAIKVTKVTPPAVKPLDSVREVVKEEWLKEQRAKLLQTKVEQFVADARKSGNIEDAGKAAGHAPVTSMPMKRDAMSDVFSMDLMNQIFSVPPGSVVSGPAGKGDGMVIAKVVTASTPQADVTTAEYTNFRKAAAQQLGEGMVDSIAAAARQRVGVNIHQATLERATQQ